MNALAVLSLALPAGITWLAWVRSRATVGRELDRFEAELAGLGFRVGSREPWRASGEFAGRPAVVTAEPVHLKNRALQDEVQRCTRVTLRDASITGRACCYPHDRVILDFADIEALDRVELDPEFDRRFISAATEPALLRRLDPEKRRRILDLGSVLWVELSDGAVTVATTDHVRTVPRLLDWLDLAARLVEQAPLERPLVKPKLGLASYWTLVLLAPFAAFWLTFALGNVSALRRHAESLAGADSSTTWVLLFHATYLVLLAVVGVLSLVAPIERDNG